MKKILLNSLPHVLAIVLFLVVSVAYFSPIMDGYDLRQGDIDNWKGMSKETMDYRMMHGEEALWTDSMFGGMPAYQISTEHNANVFRWFILLFRMGLPGAVGTLFVALLGGYFLGLFLRVKPWVAMLMGLAIGLSTVNVLYLGAGHTAKVMAIAFIAPMLGAMIYAMRSQSYLGWALFALFMGCQITANHLQMTYYAGILLALVFLTLLAMDIVSKAFKKAAISMVMVLLAAVIAILPSSSNLLTTYEYSKYTTRGSSDLTITADNKEKDSKDQVGLKEDYILDYNYGKAERWSILFPNAFGGANGYFKMNAPESLKGVKRDIKPIVEVMDPYWGGQSSSGGAFYFGWFAVVFTLLALVFLKDNIKWAFLAATLLALGLSVKDMTGLNDFFIHHFPMYKKFRDSKMILMLLPIAWVSMAGLMLNQMLEQKMKWEEIGKKWLMVSGGILAVILLMMVQPKMIGSFETEDETDKITNRLVQFEVIKNPNAISPQEMSLVDKLETAVVDARINMYTADVQRAVLFVFLLLGCAVVMLRWSKLQLPVLVIMGLMIWADQWSVCRRYLSNDKEKGKYVRYVKADEKNVPVIPTQSDLFILENEKGDAKGWAQSKQAIVQAMGEDQNWKTYKNAEVKDQIASFAALNLSSHYRVFTLQNPFNNADVSYLHKSIGGYHGAKLKRYQEVIEFCIQPEMKDMIDSLRAGKQQGAFENTPVLNMLNAKYVVYNAENPPLINPNACGAAWFVEKLNVVKNANEEIQALSMLNPKKELVVNEKFSNQLVSSTADSLDQIALTQYAPNHLVYATNTKSNRTAVFSEIYYPEGWNCYIDGQVVQTAQVNFILRSAVVPAGEHQVEWKFEPAVWKTGTKLSSIGSVMMILLLLGTTFLAYKRR
jgi:hypothetical protein